MKNCIVLVGRYIKRLCLSALLLFVGASVFGQPADEVAVADSDAASTDTIPFTLTPHNNISVPALLNGQDTVNLMFHTAAGSVTLIRSATERLGSIHWTSADTVKSWGGEQSARYSDRNALQIGTLRWEQVPVWENEYSGPF